MTKGDSSKGIASSCPTYCDDSGGPAVFECSTSGGTFCCGSSGCCGSKLAHILTLDRVSTIGYITKCVLTPMTLTAMATAASLTLIGVSTRTASVHTGSSTTLATTATKTQSSTRSIDHLPDSSSGSIDVLGKNTTASTLGIGAIVRGVVGGIAVIGSLLVALWFLHGRRRKTSEKPPGIAEPQPIGPPPGYHNLNGDWRKIRPKNSEPYELYDGRYE